MKKIISILSCFCYLNVSLGALPELSWVCDHSDNMNLTVVAKDTGNPVVESEVIELAGIDPARAIPTSKHEYDILVNEYLSTSSDSLNYSSTFWDIIKRSEIDLKFSVITEEQTQKWLANVCIFMNWVINDSHRFFVSKMVTKFLLDTDSVLSVSKGMDTLTSNAGTVLGNVKSYDVSNNDFDFSGAKAAIVNNIEGIETKVSNTNVLLDTVVQVHTEL